MRSKLALVLAIPTVTALALGVLRAVDELDQATKFEQTTAQADLMGRVTEVVHLLQGERALAVAKIINPADVQLQTSLNAQISAVNEAVAALRTQEDQVRFDDPTIQQRFDRGLARLDALAPLRTSVNTPPYSELAAFTTYSSVLDSLIQLGRGTSSVEDGVLLRDRTNAQALTETKEFTAREDAALEIAALRNAFTGILLDQVRAAQSSAAASLDVFKANATTAEIEAYTDTVSGPEVDTRAQLAATALAHAANGATPGISRDALASASAVNLDKLRAVETGLLDSVRARSDELAGAALMAAWRDIGFVLGALVLALGLTVVISRAMLKPLRVLNRSALDIAYSRLPQTVHKILEDADPMAAAKHAAEPVPITTREEIGEVARSFDAVHEQAIKMAAEQALLRENVNGIFVNLSRRSQRLVERQLSVIDRLEADEQDPDHLASLFELDHLATRLRRNGESLLVLSGAGLAKSVPKPVCAADVIGAAVSEIEQYARVEVGVIPDVAVRGLTVHDLVHLLAELLDNATYFSEPETKVNVRAVVTRRKALAIQITDRGVGMSEEQLGEANKRMVDPPELDVSVTRRMGLYVVARLARRHGVEVRLRENEDIDGGVIARVVVPAELLGPVSAEAPPPLPQSASEISWPSAEAVDAPPEVPAQRPRSPSAAEQTAAGGLRPLDEPISLDDLVAGSSSAAFLSQGRTSSSPEPKPNGGRQSDQFNPPELPKREPRFTPPEPGPEPEPVLPEPRVLDDDVPTKRLPIYQSVVSRWFAEGGDKDRAGEVAAEPETEDSAEVAPEQAPQEQTAGVADDAWRSVADEGWQAARALLDKKAEETTSAGLPKRVPNAYLIPGSVSGGEPDSFVDRTAGQPGQSAIARSATTARERMVSFQHGYTSGRHALREGTGGRSVSVDGGESTPPDAAVRSDE